MTSRVRASGLGAVGSSAVECSEQARAGRPAVNHSRWDFPYLGMQVLIEGLALAAFRAEEVDEAVAGGAAG